MSKHTKGPWKWTVPELNTDTHQELHQANFALGEGDSILYHGADWPIEEANARLIAAAPDLLEAGEKAVSLLESLAKALIANGLTCILDSLNDEHGGDKHGKGSTTDKLRQIIAKATK